LGIVAVFLVSGMHHAVGGIARTGSLLRSILWQAVPWLISGVLCSITFQWVLYRMRGRVRAAVLGLPVPREKPVSSTVGGAASLFSVLLVMGLLLSAEEVFGRTSPFSVVAGTAPDAHRFMLGGAAEAIPGATTDTRPSIATDDGKVYVAWRGRAGDSGLFWSTRDRAGWTSPRALGSARSPAPPVLATTSAGLAAAWTDADEEGALRWAMLAGESWGAPVSLAGAHAAGEPALAADGDALYAAWRGADDGIWWTRFEPADPSSAPAGRPIGSWKTSAPPAIGLVDGVLYAIWSGVDIESTALFSSTFNGRDWGPRRRIAEIAATSAPAVAGVSHRLVLAWRGADWDPDVHFTDLVDGVWALGARTALESCSGPAIAAYGSRVFLATRGVESTRCHDSDFGGEWDVISVWVTGIDLGARGPFPISASLR